MTIFQRYLAEEIAIDHADGLLPRREALRRLTLLGLSLPAATALLAACGGGDDTAEPARSAAPQAPGSTSAAPAPKTEAITFGGLQGAWAAAPTPKGAVLVIHENRGLNDHIRSVAARLAGDGYSALAIDLLSREGGTRAVGGDAEAMAALSRMAPDRFAADMRAGVAELARRAPGKKIGAVGFCFGGGMVWLLLTAKEDRLAAAVPFYGPLPDGADFGGSRAAVFGIYAAQDDRVNATRDAATAALRRAGLTHRIETFPGVDHAFFNDTGPRHDAQAAARAYRQVLDWFGRHLA